ncbi:MAG: hypothetical protein IJ243_10775 [Prevotella sp.]|nr:hypothetical protein [Prevotella sp.]
MRVRQFTDLSTNFTESFGGLEGLPGAGSFSKMSKYFTENFGHGGEAFWSEKWQKMAVLASLPTLTQ